MEAMHMYVGPRMGHFMAGSLALQMEQLEMRLQKEKDNSQEWETLTEELVNELEQKLNEVDTLKADRAEQVGPPEHMPPLAPLPARGSDRDHSHVLVIDQ